MSRGSQETRTALLKELARQYREFNGHGASFFRAAAGRIGMPVTDLQVIDILDSTGLTTAGQLAELTGLTTGAITQMLNRLEAAGLVRRERDPNDGRKVIVRLAPDANSMREVTAIFDAVARASDELVAGYDDEQIAFLVEFLKRGNALSQRVIAQMQETPSDEQGIYSAPSGDLESARLVVSSGTSALTLRADDGMADLYQARFEGPVPEVTAKDGVVAIRYPRRLWVLDKKRAAEVTLNAAIPWHIAIQGKAASVAADLSGLDLAEFEIKGGYNSIRLQLPTPTGAVPVLVSGAALALTIRRPAGVAVRAHLK